jgi:hypothetical protein
MLPVLCNQHPVSMQRCPDERMTPALVAVAIISPDLGRAQMPASYGAVPHDLWSPEMCRDHLSSCAAVCKGAAQIHWCSQPMLTLPWRLLMDDQHLQTLRVVCKTNDNLRKAARMAIGKFHLRSLKVRKLLLLRCCC